MGKLRFTRRSTASAQQGPGLAFGSMGAQVTMPLEPVWGLLVAMKRGEGSALAEATRGCRKKYNYPT